ncbi:hypothetical protein [Spongiibacter tropicus]|uniref:hypothetical protein n=1 Tax=Spongiibacter tropicus TaxID=454602 RepID=UPI0003B6BB6A|nr:hypothetical protein [Spongiibacter tropicus]
MNKILTTSLLMLGSSAALAHPGHGNWASFGHDYEHLIWLLAAIGSSALIVRLLLSRKGKDSDAG